ncbi:hypothetical protein, partial [Leclercia sp.]|uniref:hypothetical protein n=1 Tax=Leclercia sp. TaxID=1898428 RepID=UPI0028BE6B7C
CNAQLSNGMENKQLCLLLFNRKILCLRRKAGGANLEARSDDYYLMLRLLWFFDFTPVQPRQNAA